MAQMVKSLLHKHEGLSSEDWHMVPGHRIVTLALGKQEDTYSSLAILTR